MEKSENIYRSRKKMLLDNFLGGIVWSIGVWIGTTIIVALLVYFFSKINFIPIIGDFVAEISKYVASQNTPFHF
jgi:hypothetical protein